MTTMIQFIYQFANTVPQQLSMLTISSMQKGLKDKVALPQDFIFWK